MQIVWAHTARRFAERCLVTHEVQGPTYSYRSLQKPESVAVHGLRQLLDGFCGGFIEQPLMGMWTKT